jgi:hypothetical protein
LILHRNRFTAHGRGQRFSLELVNAMLNAFFMVSQASAVSFEFWIRQIRNFLMSESERFGFLKRTKERASSERD